MTLSELLFRGFPAREMIIAACLVGFLRLRPAKRQWGQFVGGGVLAIAFLLVMVFTVGPPEAAVHIRHAFGL